MPGSGMLSQLFCEPTIRAPQKESQIPRERIRQLKYEASRNTASSRSRRRRCADQGQSDSRHRRGQATPSTVSCGRPYQMTLVRIGVIYGRPRDTQRRPGTRKLPHLRECEKPADFRAAVQGNGNKKGGNPCGLYTALILYLA